MLFVVAEVSVRSKMAGDLNGPPEYFEVTAAELIRRASAPEGLKATALARYLRQSRANYAFVIAKVLKHVQDNKLANPRNITANTPESLRFSCFTGLTEGEYMLLRTCSFLVIHGKEYR